MVRPDNCTRNIEDEVDDLAEDLSRLTFLIEKKKDNNHGIVGPGEGQEDGSFFVPTTGSRNMVPVVARKTPKEIYVAPCAIN